MLLIVTDPKKAVASTPVCRRGLAGGGVKCAGGVTSAYGGSPGRAGTTVTPARTTTGPVSPTDLVSVTEIGLVGGEDCTYSAAITPAERAQGQLGTLGAVSGPINGPLPPCPAQPTAAAKGRVPPVSPAQLAEKFWYTVHLPTPKPTSRPDYATTGKLTYLAAGDTNAPPPWTDPTPLGTLRITARATYTVDWGDSTPLTGPYTTAGGPYPTGTITHTYDTTGTVTITVHEDWTATWTIGAIKGTLADLHTTGTLPNFPVRQIQAVITG
jgi:hypothetical protein